MKIKSSHIKGVYSGRYLPFKDNRGEFKRIFCKKTLNKSFPNNIKQSNISYNKKKYTMRGFHYQIGSSAENKIITCLEGKVYDIVVDLRPASKTYLKWEHFEINSKLNDFIILPKGCANAFLTLEEHSLILYLTDQYYNLKMERGIRYDSPYFNFSWPKKPVVISKKDKKLKRVKI
tara:strand:+ start:473 stop:1000 length:528 start_codon:yes stop_codon:yes gene_type:complete